MHPPAHPWPPSSPQPRWLKKKKNKSDLIWLSPSYCQGLPEQCKTRQSGTWLKVTECSVVFALHSWCWVQKWNWRQKLRVGGVLKSRLTAFDAPWSHLYCRVDMDEQLPTTEILQLCPCTCLHEKICSLCAGSNGIISLEIRAVMCGPCLGASTGHAGPLDQQRKAMPSHNWCTFKQKLKSQWRTHPAF